MVTININKLIEDAMLMKQNRADLVKALNEIGFTQVNDKTPLSSIAKYMQWSGGLLDIRLATFSKIDKQHRYWTYEEWMDQSAQARAGYIQMGVVVRAERKEFIISKDNITSESGATSMQWCTRNGDDVKGLDNLRGIPRRLDDINSERNTDLILAFADSMNLRHPAAERARAYRCCSLADGGVEDPTVWSLPAIGILWLMYKYLLQINAELSRYGMQPIGTGDWYWSSTEGNSSYAWIVYMNNGNLNNNNKTNANRVRAVAPVVVGSAAI